MWVVRTAIRPNMHSLAAAAAQSVQLVKEKAPFLSNPSGASFGRSARPLDGGTGQRFTGDPAEMDHWTLGSQVTTYHYNATSSRLDPAPHAFGMRRRGADSETQTHGATPDETATPDRRPKPSTADWRREAGSSAGTPQQLPTCIGAPNKMETNTGHSGMELPERSAPFSFDTWPLPTEVTMRLRNCSRNHHRPVPIATLHSHKSAHWRTGPPWAFRTVTKRFCDTPSAK